MAIILFRDLLDAIERDERYRAVWEAEVPAETSLKIKFSESTPIVRTQEFTVVDGSELVIRMGEDGRVVSLEIT